MSKVTKLAVYKNKQIKLAQKQNHKELIDAARSVPQDADGWVVVAYKRNKDTLGSYV